MMHLRSLLYRLLHPKRKRNMICLVGVKLGIRHAL